MAFPSVSEQGVTPPYFNMVQQQLLANAQFSIWLNPDVNALDAGELMFGGVNEERFSGELQEIPLSEAA